MIAYAVRRIFWSLPVVLATSVLVFIAMKITSNPNAVLVGSGASAEDMQRYRADLGLDRPDHEQYLTWLGNFVRGDLGQSIQTRRDVWPELWEALRNSLQLGFFAFGFYLLLGVTIGVVAALRHNSMVDQAATGASFVLLSVPQFLLALILMIVAGIYLKETVGDWVTLSNGTRFDMWSRDRMTALVLPVMVVAAQQTAIYSRHMRSNMLEVLNADYLRTARAKGVKERRVIVRHGVRNALIPVVTLSAIDIGALVSGLIVTEQVFRWNGMGLYFLRAFGDGDYIRVLPWAMIVAGAVVVFNLVADLLYGVLDPRVRHE